MSRLILAAVLFAGTTLAVPLATAAQPSPPPTDDAASSANKAPPPPAAPAPNPDTSTDSKTVTNPNLSVASVKLDSGYRASKVIGAAVYNDQNQQIGTVDDLVLNTQNQVVLSVISVGGFLGVGGKLVAMPYENLHRDNGKITIPNADKNSLASMPSFTWNP